MNRHAIDRWTDTTPFRLVLGLAGLAVVPVLLMGVHTTVIGGAVMLAERPATQLEPVHAAFALVSIGGALGFLGYLRAHWGVKDPSRHNVTATLIFLAAGVLAALAVAGAVVVTTVEVWLEAWATPLWLLPGGLFAAANLVWALAGIAWMQRLMSRYAEKTGRAFDGLPVVLLFVAIALVLAATLQTATL